MSICKEGQSWVVSCRMSIEMDVHGISVDEFMIIIRCNYLSAPT